MATLKDVFIGRNPEQDRLYELISEHPLLSVHLHGYGGVGKTRLVQAIQQNYAGSGQTVPVYIDFDDIRNRRIETFEDAIARAYGGDTWNEYQELKQEFKYSQNIGLFDHDPELKHRKREKLLEYLRPPAGRNLLLIFDTFERIEERLDKSDFLEVLFRWLRSDIACYEEQAPKPGYSVHVIFSGRPFSNRADRAAVESHMKQLFDRANFISLPVRPFVGEEIGDYFTAVNEQVLDGYLERFLDFNNPRVIKKLEMLSEGKPIFLGLVSTLIVYQKEKWSGNAILALSFKELQSRENHYRNEFQKSLLTGLQGLGSDVSYAILYMSIMKDFPAGSPALWCRLLRLSESNSQALLENLSNLFFIRENFTLHDELIRLIRRYLWQDIAPIRAYILPLMIEATEAMIADLPALPGEPGKTWDATQREEERQAYEFQILYYKLLSIQRSSASQEEALELFKELRDKTQENTSRRRLLEIVQDPLYRQLLSDEFKAETEILQTRIRNEEGGSDKQPQINPALSPDGRVAALCALAYSQRGENPDQARRTYEQALDLARKEDIRPRMAEVHNYLGMTYRRLNQYDQAIAHFKESIRLYKDLEELGEKAAAENNLAYVYRLKGDYDIAFHFARRAFTTRKENNDQVGLAYSNQTLGELYRDQNDLEMAKKCFSEAKHSFASRSMDAEVARVDIALANIARKQGYPALVEELLNESIRLFKHLKNQAGLADAQNEYGCELRKRGREFGKNQKLQQAQQAFERAEKHFQLSIESAIQTSYWYRLTDSLSDLALLYMYWYEYSGHDREEYLLKAQDVAFLAVSQSRRYKMILPESRALEAIGNIYYYAQKKYFKAFAQYYLPACLLLAEYQGRAIWRYHQVFDRVHKRMVNHDIPEDLIAYTAAYMADRWEAEGKAQVAPGFLEILQDVAGSGL